MSKDYNIITSFEKALSEFTGAPYVVATDCCTHAIELCLTLMYVRRCKLPAKTYLSIPMTLKLLEIDFEFTSTVWQGEYNFEGTPIWDSARLLGPAMYRPGQYQCLSFGPGKPLDNTRGGAILLDNEEHFQKLKMMSNDGRDLSIARWEDQQKFEQGYHYMMRIEEAESAMTKLKDYQDRGQFAPEYKTYPDCRALTFI